MKTYINIIFIIILLISLGCTTTTLPPEKQPKPPTKIECTTNSECVRGGCSGTLCHPKSEQIYTTCEYLPEYGCYKLINCGCVDNKCQWEKTGEFENCIKDKRQ